MKTQHYTILATLSILGAILLAILAALGHTGPATDTQVAALLGAGTTLAGRGKTTQ